MSNTKRFNWMQRTVLLAAVAVAPLAAHAAVFAVNIGTGAPPATLGPYVMAPFSLATQNAIASGTVVPSLAAPLGGDLGFGPSLQKLQVPDPWQTWSHGYTGAVFYRQGNAAMETLTLPAGTRAFYFYYEGQTLGSSSITATTNSGATVGAVLVVAQGGARGFGFYSDDPNDPIVTVLVSSTDTNGFALAEFGVGNEASFVPATTPIPTLSQWSLAALMALLALGGAGVLRRRGLFRR